MKVNAKECVHSRMYFTWRELSNKVGIALEKAGVQSNAVENIKTEKLVAILLADLNKNK